MDVRITPYSSLIPLSKARSNTSPVYNRNRFSSTNAVSRGVSNSGVSSLGISSSGVPRSDTSSRSIFQQDRTHLEKPKYLLPTKGLRSNNNSLLLISKKDTSNPKLTIKITPNMMQPTNKFRTEGLADDRRVLLYQQVERNKFSSNRAELINRFNYKV